MSGHFEIHVNDVARAQVFYTGLFGWTYTPMAGAEAVEYHFAEGPNLGDELTVGMMRRMGDTPEAGGPVRGGTMTFEVDDCDATYAWALENGGAEALPPMDYPGVGRAAYVEDGEGNIVGFVTPEEGAA